MRVTELCNKQNKPTDEQEKGMTHEAYRMSLHYVNTAHSSTHSPHKLAVMSPPGCDLKMQAKYESDVG